MFKPQKPAHFVGYYSNGNHAFIDIEFIHNFYNTLSSMDLYVGYPNKILVPNKIEKYKSNGISLIIFLFIDNVNL